MGFAWQDLLTALALVLVFEGIVPFLSPSRFKRTMLLVLQQDDRMLRVMGLTIMLAGLGLLYFARS